MHGVVLQSFPVILEKLAGRCRRCSDQIEIFSMSETPVHVECVRFLRQVMFRAVKHGG